MIKYEITQLHKIAQMGKECCDHISKYTTDDKLLETIRRQRDVYKQQMLKMEEIYYGLDDISPIKSIYFSWMLRSSLALRHNTEDLIRSLLKGNIMGVHSLASFIQCPFNSEKSKVYAREMLQAVNENVSEIMDEYLYREDNLLYEY